MVDLARDDTIATTVVNYEEQMRGWMALLARAKGAEAEIFAYGQLIAHLDMFRTLDVLPYEQAAAELTHELRSQRIRVGVLDLKIAAITLISRATLVTRNMADFGKTPNLRIEDWSVE